MKIKTEDQLEQIKVHCRTFKGRLYSRKQASLFRGLSIRFAAGIFTNKNIWIPLFKGRLCRSTDAGGHPFLKTYTTLEEALGCCDSGIPYRILVVRSTPDNYGNAVPA
jgi:hypothetical protein